MRPATSPPPAFLARLGLAVRRALLTLADALVPGQLAAFEKSVGAMTTGAMALAAKHRIADLLAKGPRSSQELAKETRLSHDALDRTMRALVANGVFARTRDGRYRNNGVSSALSRGAWGSVGPFAEYFGTRSNLEAWSDFAETVRTGRNAFERVFGTSVWAWFDAHPDERQLFAQTMVSLTELLAPVIAGAYPWREVQTVCDVGGGRGQLLAEILARGPHLKGMLLDGVGVIELARRHLSERGLVERVELHAGSFFERVPPGADAYVLKDVLHDWDDARSLAILDRCRDALGPNGRVLVSEMLVEPDTRDRIATFQDLHMMTTCCDGRQRSRAQFEALFAKAGLRLARVFPTVMGVCVVEGVRA